MDEKTFASLFPRPSSLTKLIIRPLSVLALIETDGLLFRADSEAHDCLDDHEDHKGHDSAVDKRDQNGDNLGPQLTGVAVEKPLARLVDRRISEHAGQDRA